MDPKKDPYPSNTTDHEWKLIAPLLPKSSKPGRPPKYERRVMGDAIFYPRRGRQGQSATLGAPVKLASTRVKVPPV